MTLIFRYLTIVINSRYLDRLILPSLLLLQVVFSGCVSIERNGIGKAPKCRVINSYPHDRDAQTEGLVFKDGFLFEGTGPGNKTPSSLRKVDLKSGNVIRNHLLPEFLFGEGITIFKNRIIQLTYKSGIGFVYNKEDFGLLDKFSYPSEGWGITHDNEYLIMSDGTSTLYYLDPNTYEIVRRVNVHDNHGPVNNLNELEYINGYIYANIFTTPKIVRIQPDSGEIKDVIDLSLVLEDWLSNTRLLYLANGIAYDPDKNSLYITGKYWPKLFAIECFY